ncbi:unnamed protein product [Schistocephalus solidus]|uniref:Tumor necrosis factor alpha-induced protein 8-like protein 2 n=1 Tax=Schistocephalus solidus TaxID=70667 RepID=A0A183SVJ6_SCHSO|nr:unnamed protein product [Schistocephalus solidus]
MDELTTPATGSSGRSKEKSKSFNPRNITLQAQKKLACSFPNQTKKLFMDDVSLQMLESLHKITHHFLASEKEAERKMRQFIKISIKFAILHMNGFLSSREEESMWECRDLLRSAASLFIKYTSHISYEAQKAETIKELHKLMQDVGRLSQEVLKGHLTPKNIRTIQSLAEFFSSTEFLTALLSKHPPYQALSNLLVTDLQDLIDRGQF